MKAFFKILYSNLLVLDACFVFVFFIFYFLSLNCTEAFGSNSCTCVHLDAIK